MFKNLGVKKFLLAAIVNCCPENHYNQKIMLNSMLIERLEWGTTVDLKMAMSEVGKSGGQSTYGCPYCDMPKPYQDGEFNLLSLANLRDSHKAFVAA